MTPSTRTLPRPPGRSLAGPLARPFAAGWPRGWRAAAGLTAVAAGAALLAGAFLPWVEAFAGLIQVPGVQGLNGRILAAAGVVIIAAGLYHLVRGGQAARWVAGLAGFAAAAFSGYLLIQLSGTMRALGGDSMVIARGGPGLWVAAAGSTAAFATLFFPPASQATLRRERRSVLAWAADRESAGPRRALQLALGVVWLLDAALQYQPYMFSKMFPAMMLTPSGTGGEPAFISGPVLGLTRLVATDPAAWNALFATIQLALAVGLLWRATARAALAGTVAWALSVWWLGEGLGGLFIPGADPLTGAPGAALLYVLVAVLAWPARTSSTCMSSARADSAHETEASLAVALMAGDSVAGGSPLGRYARLAWVVFWGLMAFLMLRAPASASPLTAGGGPGAALIAIGLAAAFVLAAAGILRPVTVRPAVLLAAAAAAFLWVAGEHFGSLFTGSATDPSSGPLLLLIAAAFWPAWGRLRPQR
jgi:hypothetical protein